MARDSKIVRPPALARMMLRLSSSQEHRETMLGDMEEEFAERAEANVGAANAWYFGQALASATPLLQQRINQSPLITALLVVSLTAMAFFGVHFWEETVARGTARLVARQFETAPPIAYARFAYVGMQMIVVAAAAAVIATLTFRVENGMLRNTASRLGMLAAIVLAPPFIARFGPDGYTLEFLIPWAGAMLLAIVGGAALATRLAGRR